MNGYFCFFFPSSCNNVVIKLYGVFSLFLYLVNCTLSAVTFVARFVVVVCLLCTKLNIITIRVKAYYFCSYDDSKYFRLIKKGWYLQSKSPVVHLYVRLKSYINFQKLSAFNQHWKSLYDPEDWRFLYFHTVFVR